MPVALGCTKKAKRVKKVVEEAPVAEKKTIKKQSKAKKK